MYENITYVFPITCKDQLQMRHEPHVMMVCENLLGPDITRITRRLQNKCHICHIDRFTRISQCVITMAFSGTWLFLRSQHTADLRSLHTLNEDCEVFSCSSRHTVCNHPKVEAGHLACTQWCKVWQLQFAECQHEISGHSKAADCITWAISKRSAYPTHEALLNTVTQCISEGTRSTSCGAHSSLKRCLERGTRRRRETGHMCWRQLSQFADSTVEFTLLQMPLVVLYTI